MNYDDFTMKKQNKKTIYPIKKCRQRKIPNRMKPLFAVNRDENFRFSIESLGILTCRWRLEASKQTMIFLIFSLFFDSQHCKRKCLSLFAGSPSKKRMCLGTCTNGFIEKEKIQFGQRKMKKEVSQCLSKCSENVNSSTDFKSWLKCRKKCVSVPNTDQFDYFAPDQCVSECDQHWKGTEHLQPCHDQCSSFQKNFVNSKPLNPDPKRVQIFTIW